MRVVDTIDDVVTTVQERVIRPLLLVARAIVFGIIVATMALVVSILFSIAVVRLLDVYAFRGRCVGVGRPWWVASSPPADWWPGRNGGRVATPERRDRVRDPRRRHPRVGSGRTHSSHLRGPGQPQTPVIEGEPSSPAISPVGS